MPELIYRSVSALLFFGFWFLLKHFLVLVCVVGTFSLILLLKEHQKGQNSLSLE